MFRLNQVIAIACCLCITATLSGCGNPAPQYNAPSLTTNEAIKLAKDAGKQLPSPPRTNNVTAPDWHKFTEVTLWPDQPSFRVASISICGNPMPGADICSVPITYTTVLETDSTGAAVTFQSSWRRPGYDDGVHSWHFYVNNERHVDFKGEDGEQLPSVPR